MWYTQREQPFRFGLWTVLNGFLPVPFLIIYYGMLAILPQENASPDMKLFSRPGTHHYRTARVLAAYLPAPWSPQLRNWHPPGMQS